LSANTLTKILREIEYGEIPAYILLQAAKRGITFHDAVQTFVQTGQHPLFVDLKDVSNLEKIEKKIHETINFLKEKNSSELKRKHEKLMNILDACQKEPQSLERDEKIDRIEKDIAELEKEIENPISFKNNFLGKEKLHYAFYKNELLATYVDLEFSDHIIELKSNSIKLKGGQMAEVG
jgi:predicted RNase H-like nuclease (RuvC/YqgF family)